MKLGNSIVVRTQTSFNGSHEHPAIVNRVWSPDMVNCTVLPDCGTPFCMTSVHVYPSKEGAPEGSNIGWHP